MIIEQEIIEQIEEETGGRPLSWLVEFMLANGATDPMRILCQMWRAHYLALADATGLLLPDWRSEEIFRLAVPCDDVAVLATESGSAWVHG